MANLAAVRRAFQDGIGDVLGKQGATCSRAQLRPAATDLGDVVVERARQTLLVADESS
jgi:hypothetical protein